jgi:hypothetical protein
MPLSRGQGLIGRCVLRFVVIFVVGHPRSVLLRPARRNRAAAPRGEQRC